MSREEWWDETESSTTNDVIINSAKKDLSNGNVGVPNELFEGDLECPVRELFDGVGWITDCRVETLKGGSE